MLNRAMETLSVILSLISIVQGILNLKDKFKSNENKNEVSQLLMSIGNLLEEVALEMKMGQYPASKCAELNYYLRSIKDKLSEYMKDAEIKNLENLIMEAYQVERLFGELQASNSEQRMLNFEKLDEAAGSFRAASRLYSI